MTEYDERFDSLKRCRRQSGRWNSAEPALGLRKNGTLSINYMALKLLGDPDRLVLVCSRDHTLIGVSPVSEDDPDGYKVNKASKGKRSGYIDVSAALRSLEIQMEVSVRGKAKQYLGGLFLDLKDTEPSGADTFTDPSGQR